MKYILAQNDLDGHKDETFYYVVSDDSQSYIKTVDMNCNEMVLPEAFSLIDRDVTPPSCA